MHFVPKTHSDLYTHTHTHTLTRTHTYPPTLTHGSHVSFHSKNVICLQNLFQQTPQVTIINFVSVHAKLVHVNLYRLHQNSFLPLFCQIRLIYNFAIASQISRATPILYTSYNNGGTIYKFLYLSFITQSVSLIQYCHSRTVLFQSAATATPPFPRFSSFTEW